MHKPLFQNVIGSQLSQFSSCVWSPEIYLDDALQCNLLVPLAYETRVPESDLHAVIQHYLMPFFRTVNPNSAFNKLTHFRSSLREKQKEIEKTLADEGQHPDDLLKKYQVLNLQEQTATRYLEILEQLSKNSVFAVFNTPNFNEENFLRMELPASLRLLFGLMNDFLPVMRVRKRLTLIEHKVCVHVADLLEYFHYLKSDCVPGTLDHNFLQKELWRFAPMHTEGLIAPQSLIQPKSAKNLPPFNRPSVYTYPARVKLSHSVSGAAFLNDVHRQPVTLKKINAVISNPMTDLEIFEEQMRSLHANRILAEQEQSIYAHVKRMYGVCSQEYLEIQLLTNAPNEEPQKFRRALELLGVGVNDYFFKYRFHQSLQNVDNFRPRSCLLLKSDGIYLFGNEDVCHRIARIDQVERQFRRANRMLVTLDLTKAILNALEIFHLKQFLLEQSYPDTPERIIHFLQACFYLLGVPFERVMCEDGLYFVCFEAEYYHQIACDEWVLPKFIAAGGSKSVLGDVGLEVPCWNMLADCLAIRPRNMLSQAMYFLWRNVKPQAPAFVSLLQQEELAKKRGNIASFVETSWAQLIKEDARIPALGHRTLRETFFVDECMLFSFQLPSDCQPTESEGDSGSLSQLLGESEVRSSDTPQATANPAPARYAVTDEMILALHRRVEQLIGPMSVHRSDTDAQDARNQEVIKKSQFYELMELLCFEIQSPVFCEAGQIYIDDQKLFSDIQEIYQEEKIHIEKKVSSKPVDRLQQKVDEQLATKQQMMRYISYFLSDKKIWEDQYENISPINATELKKLIQQGSCDPHKYFREWVAFADVECARLRRKFANGVDPLEVKSLQALQFYSVWVRVKSLQEICAWIADFTKRHGWQDHYHESGHCCVLYSQAQQENSYAMNPFRTSLAERSASALHDDFSAHRATAVCTSATADSMPSKSCGKAGEDCFVACVKIINFLNGLAADTGFEKLIPGIKRLTTLLHDTLKEYQKSLLSPLQVMQVVARQEMHLFSLEADRESGGSYDGAHSLLFAPSPPSKEQTLLKELYIKVLEADDLEKIVEWIDGHERYCFSHAF